MNNKTNRRDFIKRTSVLPLAAATGLTTLSASGQEAIKRIGGPRLKVSLNAYSFNTALTTPPSSGKPAMTLFDLLDFCARHNFDGIDPTGYYFPGYLPIETLVVPGKEYDPNVAVPEFLNEVRRAIGQQD